MKLSTELKKARQETEHAEKMVVKWTEKSLRRREKLTELENLHMIDFLRKNQVGIDELPELVAKLPSLGGKSSVATAPKETKETPSQNTSVVTVTKQEEL